MGGHDEELEAARAANDVARMVRAVNAWVDAVRDQNGDASRLYDAVAPLVTHPSGKVRQVVAEAADVFATERFDEVSARFQRDVDHFVRAAIARAAKNRAARLAKKAKTEGQTRALVVRVSLERDRPFRSIVTTCFSSS